MIRRVIRKMLVAQIVSALTVSLCLLIDNMIIGQYLGEQAIAAYGLANPILLIMGAIGSMFAAGVQVVCSKSIGRGAKDETNQSFSAAILLTLGVSIILMVAVLICRSSLTVFLGAGSEGPLFTETRDYLTGFMIGAPASMGALVLVPFLQIAGQSTLLIIAVLSMTITDIALDLINVLVLHGGMLGMGLASALSYYIALFIGSCYLFSKKSAFHFSLRGITKSKLKRIIISGIPSVFNMASSVILVFILNKVALYSNGQTAVAALHVLITIGNSCNCISTGIGGVSLTLSGVFFNEEDPSGLKHLLSALSKYSFILGLAMGAFMVAFAPMIVRLFIPDINSAYILACSGVRCFALGLIPCCLNNALKNYYQATEHIAFTEILSVLEGFLFPAVAAILGNALVGVHGLWGYFVIGEITTLGCILSYVSYSRKSLPWKANALLLLPDHFGVAMDQMLERDIHSMNEVADTTRAAEAFCLKHGQDALMSKRISLCIEEMASNTVKYGLIRGKGKKHLQVRLLHKENRWLLRFRDDCRAFDPISFVPQEEYGALGIHLVLAIADEVQYTYSLNLNNLTIVLHQPRSSS